MPELSGYLTYDLEDYTIHGRPKVDLLGRTPFAITSVDSADPSYIFVAYPGEDQYKSGRLELLKVVESDLIINMCTIEGATVPNRLRSYLDELLESWPKNAKVEYDLDDGVTFSFEQRKSNRGSAYRFELTNTDTDIYAEKSWPAQQITMYDYQSIKALSEFLAMI